MTTTEGIVESGELAARHVDLSNAIQGAREELNRIEFELKKRMEEEDATVLGVDGYEVGVKYNYTYDVSRLAPLRELISPEDLAGIYTEPHEEVVMVSETWNMVKGRHLGKHGKDVQDILDGARIRGPGRVRVVTK